MGFGTLKCGYGKCLVGMIKRENFGEDFDLGFGVGLKEWLCG